MYVDIPLIGYTNMRDWRIWVLIIVTAIMVIDGLWIVLSYANARDKAEAGEEVDYKFSPRFETLAVIAILWWVILLGQIAHNQIQTAVHQAQIYEEQGDYEKARDTYLELWHKHGELTFIDLPAKIEEMEYLMWYYDEP